MKTKDCKTNILGTDYSIYFVEKYPDYLEEVGEDAAGLFNQASREIYILTARDKEVTESGHEWQMKRALRHEIVHAFLSESGLSSDSQICYTPWAYNEEMIDWFAIQSPKIFGVYSELGIV